MANKRLYWDAGHGGTDSGAAANGLKESNLAIKVVNYAHAYIKDNYVCDQYKDISADKAQSHCAFHQYSWQLDGYAFCLVVYWRCAV